MDTDASLPQIEYMDKCTWPFRNHPTERRVFAPWGAFGPQYRISSLDEYIIAKNRHGASIFWIIMLCAISQLAEKTFWTAHRKYHLSFGGCPRVVRHPLYLPSNETYENLTNPNGFRRRPLPQRVAKRISYWFWFYNLAFIGALWLTLPTGRNPQLNLYVEVILTAFCAVLALAFSVMIVAHGTGRGISSHQRYVGR